MNKFKTLVAAGALIGAMALSASGNAAVFSFTGNFFQDDDVQLFNFSVGATSDVTLRTWSYAGGTNAAGDLIARGGFDPILAVFDSSGVRIGQNDDGGSLVDPDPLTLRRFDTYLTILGLAAGNYQVSVMQYDNFAIGPNLSDGFRRDGEGNFTVGFGTCDSGTQQQFYDVTNNDPYCQRDGHWAFDILNVESAAQAPAPATLALLGIGLAGLGFARRPKAQ